MHTARPLVMINSTVLPNSIHTTKNKSSKRTNYEGPRLLYMIMASTIISGQLQQNNSGIHVERISLSFYGARSFFDEMVVSIVRSTLCLYSLVGIMDVYLII